jgi:hypothetical protein
VTLSSSPDLKKLEAPQAVASRPRAASPSATRAAPAALVAEDFSVVKRKLEDARRREEEAKRQADEAARRRAEQQRIQAEAEARAMAERMAAEDRADNAAFAQQIGAALGQLGQSFSDYQKVRKGDLTPLGIYPTPASAPPAAYVPPPAASGSSGARTASAPQPTPTPAGARIATGYAPPTPTPRPASMAPTPASDVSLPEVSLSNLAWANPVNTMDGCSLGETGNVQGVSGTWWSQALSFSIRNPAPKAILVNVSFSVGDTRTARSYRVGPTSTASSSESFETSCSVWVPLSAAYRWQVTNVSWAAF